MTRQAFVWGFMGAAAASLVWIGHFAVGRDLSFGMQDVQATRARTQLPDAIAGTARQASVPKRQSGSLANGDAVLYKIPFHEPYSDDPRDFGDQPQRNTWTPSEADTGAPPPSGKFRIPVPDSESTDSSGPPPMAGGNVSAPQDAPPRLPMSDRFGPRTATYERGGWTPDAFRAPRQAPRYPEYRFTPPAAERVDYAPPAAPPLDYEPGYGGRAYGYDTGPEYGYRGGPGYGGPGYGDPGWRGGGGPWGGGERRGGGGYGGGPGGWDRMRPGYAGNGYGDPGYRGYDPYPRDPYYGDPWGGGRWMDRIGYRPPYDRFNDFYGGPGYGGPGYGGPGYGDPGWRGGGGPWGGGERRGWGGHGGGPWGWDPMTIAYSIVRDGYGGPYGGWPGSRWGDRFTSWLPYDRFGDPYSGYGEYGGYGGYGDRGYLPWDPWRGGYGAGWGARRAGYELPGTYLPWGDPYASARYPPDGSFYRPDAYLPQWAGYPTQRMPFRDPYSALQYANPFGLGQSSGMDAMFYMAMRFMMLMMRAMATFMSGAQ